MTVAQGPFLAAVLLLVSSGLHCSSPPPACPESCTCQRASLLNCSSAGLSLVPQHIQDSVTELDFSHNLLDSVTLHRPHHNLRNVWLGNNSITQLSLCMERNPGNRHLHRLRPGSRHGCVSWAPTLQLLSVERNQLEQFPQGMEGTESLQVLQLSFNMISTLRPGDLSHLRQLKELHLQHNLITSLHPQMFQDLAQLQVLDLSFNMLTSLHPSMYLSLRNTGVDVRLAGNRWHCDCSMRSLRRRMAYDISRGLQAWSVVCASPSILSGRDLLELEEDDLQCFGSENGPELHRDVTVYSGSKILLSCSTQDSMWWTPSGQASASQPQDGLHISDITERDTGIYVCVSEEHEVMSVFNLQISKTGGTRRKTRSLPRTSREIIPQGTPNRLGQERNQRATQSDLALAVCLSILFTFLIAFILGVLARPCIDVLWGRVTKKKSSSATHSVSSVEQRQYDNEAYSNGEEPEHIGSHRERRVTFSTVDYREDHNVQYYDTGNQESTNNDAVIDCEAPETEKNTKTAGDSGSENSSRQSSPVNNQRVDRDLSSITDAGRTHNMEFEHIPDPVELEKRRSLSSSDSSLSDKVYDEDQMTRGDHKTPKSPKLAEHSVQQRADSSKATKVEMPHISIEGTSELPSEPFTDWSPHPNTNLTDPDLWQENEEQFEFSDSVRSTSARSSNVCGSFNDSKIIVESSSGKQKMGDMSSSSSYVSEDEPTQYSVNSDEEEEIKRNNKPEVTKASLKQDANFEQKLHTEDPITPSVQFNQGDYRYDTQRPAVRTEESFSSHSSDSDGEDYTVKKGRVASLAVSSHSKSLNSGAPSTPAAYLSSLSSESEAKITDLKHSTDTLNEGNRVNEPETLLTDLDRQCIPQINRHADIKAPLTVSDSSSSDESMDYSTKNTKKLEHGEVDMAGLPTKGYQSVSHDAVKTQSPALDPGHVTPIKRRAPLPPTDSSSSGKSADETMDRMQKQGQMQMTSLPNTQTQWPALDLEHTTSIKRRLDIKVPSPYADSSSSSDSEDETRGQTEKQRPGKVDIAGPTFQGSQIESHNADTRWPLLDLEHVPHIKRRLDIKAPSPPPDLSSSSDSEDETTNQIKKQEQGQMNIARLPSKVSQTGSYDTQTQQPQPALQFEHTTSIKRRLDIKVPSPYANSSSSSDTDDETTQKRGSPGKVEIAQPPFQKSQTGNHDLDTEWPALDLKHSTPIKRRLDIKVTSPPLDSSSSSDSEEETTGQINKQEQRHMDTASLPSKVSKSVSYDFEHTTSIKRRLDIKAPTLESESSSNSDSGDETICQTEKQRLGNVAIAGPTFQGSQIESHDADTRWPILDLEHTTSIKRRLDIKAPSPASASSSSSDSEDETTGQTEKLRPGNVAITGPTFQGRQTESHHLDTRWPLLDLEHVPRLKRRLDIKVPSPPLDSSSSSDCEDETTSHIKKQEQGQIHMARLPSKLSQSLTYGPQAQWPAIDLDHTTSIKRRLDIKAPSPDSDSSSSSESGDETIHHTERLGKVEIAGPPFQEFQTQSHDPDTRWPLLDLELVPRIKRRLDIKVPSPPPNSSSSSDSEDETTNHIKKQEQGQTYMERSKVSHTYGPQTQWPAIDLDHTTSIKRCLDIKAPSPDSDSSSSSDSGDETRGQTENIHHTERPVKVDIAGPTFQGSQIESHDADTRWPILDLDHTTHIKRRLDIKAPSPASASSSSSDSEDETTGQTEKLKPGNVAITAPSFQGRQTESHDADTRWPILDLDHTTHIKRCLDIKAPSPPPDSSSSSDSEDETTSHIKKQEQGQIHMERLPSKVSHTYGPQTQWPAIDLDHTTSIKRRLDIKAPSPDSDSSSSSESEDETTHHTERPGKVDIAGPPFQESQTETRWLALDLENTMRIKRRIDIKAPSPASASFSSSDSGDKTAHLTKIERPGVVGSAGPLFQESQKVSQDPETQWPAVDLGNTTRIKRRLDIKAPSPPPDSLLTGGSKNSDEQEKGMEVLRYSSTTVEADSRWPGLDLNSDLYVKRRLDIKAHSLPPESSSSSDESEGGTTNLSVKVERDRSDLGITSHQPRTKAPELNVIVPPLNRRLNIKAPSQPSDSCSSSSDNESKLSSHTVKHEREKRYVGSPSVPYMSRRLEIKAPSPQPDPVLSSVSPGSRQSESNYDEYRDHSKLGLGVSATEKEFNRSLKTPVINIPRSSKTDHNIKLEKYTVITDDVVDKASDNVSTTPEITPELQSQWASMNLSYSRFKKRLESASHTHEPPNLPSSPPPDSPSSSSGSWTGSKSSRIRQQRRGVGVEGIIHTESSLTLDDKHGNISLSLTATKPQSQTEEVRRKSGIELKSQTSKEGEESRPHLSLTNIPHVRRALDITAPLQRESSSSSNSEDEMIDHSIPDLSLGVPRIKRRLNVKAPSPEPSTSCSESENEVTGYAANQSRYASNMSGMTDDDYLITYKRVIIKPSSPPSNSFSPSGKGQTIDHTKQRHAGTEMVTVAQGPFHSVGDRNASPAPKKFPSMSFDAIVKKRIALPRRTTDVDLPPEIRWTGVGRQLSDLPIPHPRRSLDVGLSSPQQAPSAEPELPPPDASNTSSSKSDDNIKQDREKADVTLMHTYSSLSANRVSLDSSRALHKFDNSPSSTDEILRAVSVDGNERKGLSALKAMSSERRKWDTVDDNLDKGASPQFDDLAPQGGTSFNYRWSDKDIRPLAKLPLTQLRLSSTPVEERKATDLLYGIPHYRRHDIGGIELPQGAPPPIPATPPPPYEAEGLTWTSPQSSKKQGLEGTRPYVQRRTTEETDPSLKSKNLGVYFDSSNISEV